jgi:ectoine hydroxylase-related dioxygenase (phytanoyl-CoA dioxygenase family)
MLPPLLGNDIVLWGAMIVRTPSGKSHPRHTDMESADPNSRVIIAWIGMRNAGEGSRLHLVAGSHQFGTCVQAVLANSKEEHTAITDERMLEIARAMNPSARIVEPQAQDGQAVLLDGRVWHCSHNDGKMGTRTALLLQYASADTPMPANPSYTWPFKFAAKHRVLAILGSGMGRRSQVRRRHTCFSNASLKTSTGHFSASAFSMR